jgi:hypothetical protein
LLGSVVFTEIGCVAKWHHHGFDAVSAQRINGHRQG